MLEWVCGVVKLLIIVIDLLVDVVIECDVEVFICDGMLLWINVFCSVEGGVRLVIVSIYFYGKDVLLWWWGNWWMFLL